LDTSDHKNLDSPLIREREHFKDLNAIFAISRCQSICGI